MREESKNLKLLERFKCQKKQISTSDGLGAAEGHV